MSVERIRELALAAEQEFTEAVRQFKTQENDDWDAISISSVLDGAGEASFEQYLCARQSEYNQVQIVEIESPLLEKPAGGVYFEASSASSDDELVEYVVEEPEEVTQPERSGAEQEDDDNDDNNVNDDKTTDSQRITHQNTQLNYIVEELISTEINYLKSLFFLLVNFLKPIRNILAKKSELQIAQKVCNYTKMLHRLGTNFLDDLAQAQGDVEVIGDVFLQYKTLFNLYAKLSKVWNTYMKLVRETSIQQVIRKMEAELNEAIGFERYMLKPIQRLTKYELLLNQMLKKITSEVDPTSIKMASEFMKCILNRCNTIIALESIEYNKYDEAQAGSYVMKTDLKWRVAPKKKKKKASVQVELFLFEKVVIIAVSVEGTLQYRDSILLSKLTRVDKAGSPRFTLEEVQTTAKRPRAIKLEAATVHMKQKCLQSIDKLLWGELEYLKQQQAKNYDLNSSVDS